MTAEIIWDESLRPQCFCSKYEDDWCWEIKHTQPNFILRHEADVLQVYQPRKQTARGEQDTRIYYIFSGNNETARKVFLHHEVVKFYRGADNVTERDGALYNNSTGGVLAFRSRDYADCRRANLCFIDPQACGICFCLGGQRQTCGHFVCEDHLCDCVCVDGQTQYGIPRQYCPLCFHWINKLVVNLDDDGWHAFLQQKPVKK